MANAGQHTIKYKKEGDYGQLVPRISLVEYQDGSKVKAGTCMKCAYNEDVPHSLECIWEQQRQQLVLFGLK